MQNFQTTDFHSATTPPLGSQLRRCADGDMGVPHDSLHARPRQRGAGGVVLELYMDLRRLHVCRDESCRDGVDVWSSCTKHDECRVLMHNHRAPTSGGQYHWVSEFAPEEYQQFLSYVVGWMSTLSWQAGNAADCFLTGTIAQALIFVNNPDYEPQRWQGTLFVFAMVCAPCGPELQRWDSYLRSSSCMFSTSGATTFGRASRTR